MNRLTGKIPKRITSEDFGFILIVFLLIVLVISLILLLVGFFSSVGEFGGVLNELSEYSAHEIAVNQISSGVIINKEIVNGHIVNGSGGIVTGPNGAGVIFGGNQEYIPTQYRLYVSGKYEIDGKEFEGEKYFDVPADVYQSYKVGDFFDSHDFSAHIAISLCSNCGATCDTPFCGACGAPMNSKN